MEDALSVLIVQEERIDMDALVKKSAKFKVTSKLKQIIEEKDKFIKQ